MASIICQTAEEMEENKTMSIFDSPLIQDQMETCRFVAKTIAPDGYGGFKPSYIDGAEFKAIITENNSITAQVAQADTQKTFYGVKTARNVPLEYHSIFRRADGSTMRITASEAMDSPTFSAMDMKVLQAEEYILTVEE